MSAVLARQRLGRGFSHLLAARPTPTFNPPFASLGSSPQKLFQATSPRTNEKMEKFALPDKYKGLETNVW